MHLLVSEQYIDFRMHGGTITKSVFLVSAFVCLYEEEQLIPQKGKQLLLLTYLLHGAESFLRS